MKMETKSRDREVKPGQDRQIQNKGKRHKHNKENNRKPPESRVRETETGKPDRPAEARHRGRRDEKRQEKAAGKPQGFWDKSVKEALPKHAQAAAGSGAPPCWIKRKLEEQTGTSKLAKEDEEVTDESDMEHDRDSENATDSEKQFNEGEFVTYIRKGVHRFRKKRRTGATVTQNRDCLQHSVSSPTRGRGRGRKIGKMYTII